MKGILNQKGAGLPEILVATAALMILAAGVSTYVVNQKTFNAKISGSAECRNDVEGLLREFSNSSNSRIANALTATDNTSNRSLASVGSFLPYNTLLTGGSQYTNFQNIENSVTRTYLMYRGIGTGLCSTATGINIADNANYRNIFTNTTTYDRVVAQGKTVSVRVAPINISSGAESCQAITSTTVPFGPLSSANTTNDFAFKIKVTVRKPAAGNMQEQTCSGETTLKYNSDTTAPGINGASIVGNSGAAGTTCGYSGTVFSTEPGSLFECSFDAGASWGICPGLTLASPLPNQPTSATLAYTVTTVGNTTMLVRSIDSSGNRSIAFTAPVVNCCDPAWGAWAPPLAPGVTSTRSNGCGNTETVTYGACNINANPSPCAAGTLWNQAGTSTKWQWYCMGTIGPTNSSPVLFSDGGDDYFCEMFIPCLSPVPACSGLGHCALTRIPTAADAPWGLPWQNTNDPTVTCRYQCINGYSGADCSIPPCIPTADWCDFGSGYWRVNTTTCDAWGNQGAACVCTPNWVLSQNQADVCTGVPIAMTDTNSCGASYAGPTFFGTKTPNWSPAPAAQLCTSETATDLNGCAANQTGLLSSGTNYAGTSCGGAAACLNVVVRNGPCSTAAPAVVVNKNHGESWTTWTKFCPWPSAGTSANPLLAQRCDNGTVITESLGPEWCGVDICI